MKLGKGQATRICLLVLHQFGHIAMLLLLFALILFGLFGFRLSQGPIEIPQLVSWLSLSSEGFEVHPGQVELAWAGYHKGGAVPLVLQLTDLEVRTKAGHAVVRVPRAVLSLPMADLFGGQKPFLLAGENAIFPESNVPVSWYANLWPGAGFTFSHGTIHVRVGAGHIGNGVDQVNLANASCEFSVLQDGEIQVRHGVAQLAKVGQSAPRLTFSFQGRYQQHWQGVLNVQIDKVQAQDLAALWAPDLMPNTRHWVTTHITSGQAQMGRFVFGISADGNLSHLHISSLQGQFEAQNLTLIWLNGAPPIEHMNGQMVMQGLGRALITATGGSIAGIALEHGSMLITGLDQKAQAGALQLALSGPMQTVLAVLAAPPLNLLDKTPDYVKAATGQAIVRLSAQIPFKKDLSHNEVHIQAQAILSHVSMPTPFPALRLENGQAILRTDGHNLNIQATGTLAGSAVQITVAQTDTNDHSTESMTLKGTIGPDLWHGLKLDHVVAATFAGPAPFNLTLNGPSDQAQQARLSLDLTPLGLAFPILGWTKPPAQPAQLKAAFTLQKSHVSSLQTFTMQAPALMIVAHSQGAELVVQQALIGRTQLHGTLSMPHSPGGVWVLRGSGPVLDLRLHGIHAQTSKSTPTPALHIPWQAQLAFAKVYLAAPPAPSILNARLTAAGRGDRLTHADFSATGMQATLTPRSDGTQQLTMQGADAGQILSILGIYNGMSGGTLDLHAQVTSNAIQGVLTLESARLVHAPGFMKVLQAATLYGLAEALSGPGLLLDHTTIPFSLTQDTLTLNDARSYSSALGFTASGTVSITQGVCDLDTTIIPAYALNSFLGRLPLIGHLFTAEKGGGLFAMRAHVQGKIDDPDVSVNPFSMLTPGFLRGIFGLGQLPASPPAH